MCVKTAKRFWPTLLGLVLAFLVVRPAQGAPTDEGESQMARLFKAQAVYEAKGRRDPFVQPQAGQWRNVLDKVNIETLKLTGIIRNADRSIALFTTQTGPQFGYLLKAGQLYRENHKPVTGITGVVRNPKEVVLQQGERELVFKLQ